MNGESRDNSCVITDVSNLYACPPFGYINQSYCNETVGVVLTCRSKINSCVNIVYVYIF